MCVWGVCVVCVCVWLWAFVCWFVCVGGCECLLVFVCMTERKKLLDFRNDTFVVPRKPDAVKKLMLAPLNSFSTFFEQI